FPSPEDKSPVAAVVQLGDKDRAAGRDPELIAHQVWRLGEHILPLAGDSKSAVTAGLERSAVEVVGAAACDHDRVGWTVELGAGAIGLDAEFLHGVEPRRPRLDVAGVSIVKRHAILVVFHGGVAESVDSRLRRGALKPGHGDE